MKTQTKPKETQAIQMMPVGQLRQHPQNPRKDLGDLSELTACIGDIGLFLREGENVEIFVNDDCKTARIQSLSKEALP